MAERSLAREGVGAARARKAGVEEQEARGSSEEDPPSRGSSEEGPGKCWVQATVSLLPSKGGGSP